MRDAADVVLPALQPPGHAPGPVGPRGLAQAAGEDRVRRRASCSTSPPTRARRPTSPASGPPTWTASAASSTPRFSAENAQSAAPQPRLQLRRAGPGPLGHARQLAPVPLAGTPGGTCSTLRQPPSAQRAHLSRQRLAARPRPAMTRLLALTALARRRTRLAAQDIRVLADDARSTGSTGPARRSGSSSTTTTAGRRPSRTSPSAGSLDDLRPGLPPGLPGRGDRTGRRPGLLRPPRGLRHGGAGLPAGDPVLARHQQVPHGAAHRHDVVNGRPHRVLGRGPPRSTPRWPLVLRPVPGLRRARRARSRS